MVRGSAAKASVIFPVIVYKKNWWQMMSAGVGVCIQHECYLQLQWLHMHIKLQCEVSPFSAVPKSIFTLTILLLTPQRAQQMPHNQPTTFIPALNQVKPINWASLWSEPLSKHHTDPFSLKKRREHEKKKKLQEKSRGGGENDPE